MRATRERQDHAQATTTGSTEHQSADAGGMAEQVRHLAGYEAQAAALRPGAPVQLSGPGGGASADTTHAIAARGLSGGGGALPHLDRIQQSFGHHDVSGVQAHTGAAAGRAARDLGAKGFAADGQVALAPGADLHTVAHEAAHVVQQRGGVALKDAVGHSGDVYEQHADAVADKVVAGEDAQPLLDGMAGAGGGAASSGAVQLKKDDWSGEGGKVEAPYADEEHEDIYEDYDPYEGAGIDNTSEHATRVRDQLVAEEAERKQQIADIQAQVEAKRKELRNKGLGEDEVFEHEDVKALEEKRDAFVDLRKKLRADIAVLEGESANPSAVHEVLERRGVKRTGEVVDVGAGEGRGQLDADGATWTHEDRKTSQVQDGESHAHAKKKTTSIDASGMTHSDQESHEATNAGNKTTSSKKKDTSLGKDGFSQAETESFEFEGADGSKKSQKHKKSTTVDASGFERAEEESSQDGDQLDSKSTSTKYQRGDGKLGRRKSQTTKKGQVDGDGNMVDGVIDQKDTTHSAVIGPDGLGYEGSHNRSRETAHNENLKSKVFGGATFSAVASVKKVPGEDKYWIVLTITLKGNVGGSATTHGKPGGGKASASITASGSGKMTASYRHLMTTSEAKVYLDQLGSPNDSGGQNPELATLAALYKATDVEAAKAALGGASAVALKDPDAAKNLPDGDAVQLDLEAQAEAGLEGEVGKGGLSVGANVKGKAGGGRKVFVQRKGDKVIITIDISATSGYGAGGKLEVDGTGGSVGMDREHTQGKVVVFSLDAKDPDFDDKYKAILGCWSREELTAQALEMKDDVESSSDTEVDKKSDTVGMSVLGVEGSITNKSEYGDIFEIGEDGELLRKIHGSNSGGADIGTKDNKVSASRSEDVSFEISDDGEVYGDLSESTTETNFAKMLEQHDENLDKNKLGLVTGSAKPASDKDESKAGKKLDGDALQAYINAASPHSSWMSHCPHPRLRDDWAECGKRIRAAKGDKVAVAQAIAWFNGRDGHKREDALSSVLDEAGEGLAYELPDGFKHLDAKFTALVHKDPCKSLKPFEDKKDWQGAIDEANKKLAGLEALENEFNQAAEKFERGNAAGAMLSKLSERKNALRQKIRTFKALAAGKPAPSDADTERARKLDEYNEGIKNCIQWKATEKKLFADAEAVSGAGSDTSDTVKLVPLVNRMAGLYEKWQPIWDHVDQLHDGWGFGTGGHWAYRPDRIQYNLYASRTRNMGNRDDEPSQDQLDDQKYYDEQMAKESKAIGQAASKRISEGFSAEGAAILAQEKRVAEKKRIAPGERQRWKKAQAACQGASSKSNRFGGKFPAHVDKLYREAWTKFALANQSTSYFEKVVADPKYYPKVVSNEATKLVNAFDAARALFETANKRC